MPEANIIIESTEASLIDHPAVQAWRKLGSECSVPDAIDQLRDDKSEVYRLTGVGPEGAPVIAKRCDSETAEIEYSVYKEILPHLKISALQCYGSIVEENGRFSWLFLEDAGEGEYSPDVEEHRILAGLWLGAMNSSAQRLGVATRLPDRGPASYLEILYLARSMTQEKLCHLTLSSAHRHVLEAIVRHCDFIERHWGRVERFCAGMPQTLVHGDLSLWNARIRVNDAQRTLLVMDWESAGWGVPAADLAQFAGNSLTPDIAAYWSITQECWPHLHLSDLRRLGDLGTVFRWINAVAWANWGFHDGAVKWYMGEMRCYEPQIDEWAKGTELLSELK